MNEKEMRSFKILGWEIIVEITPALDGEKPYAEVMARPYGDYRTTLSSAGIQNSVKQFSKVIRFKDVPFNYDEVYCEVDDAVVSARAHVHEWAVKARHMLDEAIAGRKEGSWYSAALAAAADACNRKGMARTR